MGLLWGHYGIHVCIYVYITPKLLLYSLLYSMKKEIESNSNNQICKKNDKSVHYLTFQKYAILSLHIMDYDYKEQV